MVRKPEQELLVEVAEGIIGAESEHPAHPYRQAGLDTRIQFEIDHFTRNRHIQTVFAGYGPDMGFLKKLNRGIGDIPLGRIEMGMLLAIGRMSDLQCLF